MCYTTKSKEAIHLQGTSAQRREQILQVLREQQGPVSASTLARRFSVSRQIVVGDIALLRASNVDILATPRGYLLQKKEEPVGIQFTVACCHSQDDMKKEMYTVVDLGGELIDVVIEHPVYGQLVGSLKAASRFDVDVFLDKMERHKAEPLCRLTGGVHLHTIRCQDDEGRWRIIEALWANGILFEKEE